MLAKYYIKDFVYQQRDYQLQKDTLKYYDRIKMLCEHLPRMITLGILFDSSVAVSNNDMVYVSLLTSPE